MFEEGELPTLFQIGNSIVFFEMLSEKRPVFSKYVTLFSTYKCIGKNVSFLLSKASFLYLRCRVPRPLLSILGAPVFVLWGISVDPVWVNALSFLLLLSAVLLYGVVNSTSTYRIYIYISFYT